MIFESFSEKETFAFAFDLGTKSKKGDIFCLIGDLGVGKTIFSKGFAQGLGIKENISSPTFNILNEYKSGRLDFFHFDVYRIINSFEMEDTGYEEYFYSNGVCLIEWAENISNLIPETAKWIEIKKDLNINKNYRKIEIKEVF